MADEKTFTKEDIDAAIAAAVAKVQESVDKLEAKRDELVTENRQLKRGREVKPEDLQAAEDRADKAEAALSEAQKQVKAITGERDKAAKALETETVAARSYALDAEINAAIAAGNIVPALVPAFTAMVKGQAKADLVDGKYAVNIGDKPAKDYIITFLGTEEGKAFKAAPANSGGDALGGTRVKADAKTITRTTFNAMDQSAQGEAGLQMAKGELKVVDA